MKVCFYGLCDEFIGLHNVSSQSSFVDRNEFDFFNDNKFDVVVFRIDNFSRPLFKNLQRHKMSGICVTDKLDYIKLEQAKSLKIDIKPIKASDIVGFDLIRYPESNHNELYANDEVWFPDIALIQSKYFDIKSSSLRIYCQSPVPLPEYAGWPNEKLLPDIIRSARKAYYYNNNEPYLSYNTIRLIGCGGKIHSNMPELPSQNDVVEYMNYKVIAKNIGIL